MRSISNQPPFLGPQYPIYPWISQVVRVFTPPLYTYNTVSLQQVALTSGNNELTSLNGDFVSPDDNGALLWGGIAPMGPTLSAIPLDTTITSVVDGQHVLMSNNASANVVEGLAAKTTNSNIASVSGKLVSGTSDFQTLLPVFDQTFVGALAIGPGIPFGTIITEVNSPTDATLSQDATSSQTYVPMIVVSGKTLANIYLAYMQQWNPLLTLRDRELVYLFEPNNIHLRPGYYDARLIGSWNLLPLLVTWCCP